MGAGRLVLPAHILGVLLLQATQNACWFMLPVIALKHFDAGKSQMLVLTAAPTVLFVLSIFWNDLFSRLSLGRFWLVYWVVAGLPLAGMGFAPSFAVLAVLAVMSSVGVSGYHPASGELLKRLYGDRRRGRIYGVIQTASLLAGAGITWQMGRWLERDQDAFRWFLPAAAGAQLVGVGILWRLAHATGIEAKRARATGEAWTLRRSFEPVLHTREVLAGDRVFARYEAAFMTYGVAWMICYALVPLIATERLGLGYEKVAESTHSPYQAALAACMMPAGLLLDKLGPARTCGLAFVTLAIYPIGLILAGSADGLFAASVLYGITHAGVSAAWMLGPVALAPTPDKVPQYVAIHATLVGLRGAVFQAAGVWLYALTGSVTWPLVIAAVALVVAGWQMFALSGSIRRGVSGMKR